jgi:acetylornithine aminotransferase
MLALAFKNDPAPLVKKLRDAGLLVVGAGGHAIRFLPPLNVKEAEIEQAISIVDSILSTFIPDEASK